MGDKIHVLRPHGRQDTRAPSPWETRYTCSVPMGDKIHVLRPHGRQDTRAPSPLETRYTCSEQNLWARLLKLTSSDTCRAESQEASSTLSRRNPRPWRLATRQSPSHHPRERQSFVTIPEVYFVLVVAFLA